MKKIIAGIVVLFVVVYFWQYYIPYSIPRVDERDFPTGSSTMVCKSIYSGRLIYSNNPINPTVDQKFYDSRGNLLTSEPKFIRCIFTTVEHYNSIVTSR